MKTNILILPLAASIVIGVSSLLTYHVFSYTHPAVLGAVDQNPSVTLTLPDQEYVITTRDLHDLGNELMIPTRDNIAPTVSYSATEGEVALLTAPQEYVIDVASLLSDIDKYVVEYPSTITPRFYMRDRYFDTLTLYNKQLNQIYRSPLNISLKDGLALTDITLDSSLLRAMLMPTTVALNIPPGIDKSMLLAYITPRLTLKQKKYFSAEFAYENTQKAVNARFMGEATPAVLGVDDGPSSHGERADKYLEVDLSQQKMYFFINGKLFREYQVSTGAEYPTPVGDFHILNKAPIAFSDIYNVWMPYWMGFKYAGDVGAYLGLHEIAYTTNVKGKPVYNHGYYIGEMMTGGCVAMEPKYSREIYNLSDVGMLVRIVQ
jgi:hypothetical protein